MKKTALSLALALIPWLLVCSAPLIQATELKTVFNTERIEFKRGTGSERCQERCSRKSGPDANQLRSEGWKIVTSSPKEVVAEAYWYVPCSSCEPHGCTCVGTEYTLQRDAPAPTAPTLDNDRDLLARENEALKRENALLKQENEQLKQQIPSLQQKR